MHTFPVRPRICLGLAAVCLLLAGCTTAHHATSHQVSSPPPPVFGSAPIAAHDDYAQTLIPAPRRLKAIVAQSGKP